MSKQSGIGRGDWCGAGFPGMTFVTQPDGSVTLRGQDVREVVVWTAKGALCPKCQRDVPLVHEKNRLSAHVWHPRDGNVAVMDRSTNSAANRAMRAFEGRKR